MPDIDLSWTDNASSENGFNIYRTTTSSPSFPADYTQITSVGADVTSYTDTNVSDNITYYYAVTAYNSDGESSPTTDSVTTPNNVVESATITDSVSDTISASSGATSSTPFRVLSNSVSSTVSAVSVSLSDDNSSSVTSAIDTIGDQQFAETGSIYISGNNESITNAAESQRIIFDNVYDNPVVMAHMTTTNGGQNIEDNVTDIEGGAATLFNIEPDLQAHNQEVHSYFVFEQGTHLTPEGYQVEAGTHTSTNPVIEGDSNPSGDTIEFTESFDSKPVILATVNSHNSDDFKTAWINNVSKDSFDLNHAIDTKGGTANIATEEVGWVAIEAGITGTIGGTTVETELTTSTSTSFTSFDSNPNVIVDWQESGDSGWADGSSLSSTSDNWGLDYNSGGGNTFGHVAFADDSTILQNSDISSTNEKVFESFESGTFDSTWNVTNATISNTRSYDGSYSFGSWGDGGVEATYSPYDGEIKLDSFEYIWKEDNSQTGHVVILYDKDGNEIMESGTENYQWYLNDGFGDREEIAGNVSDGGYNNWTKFTFRFDWDNDEYYYHLENLEEGAVREGTQPLDNSTGVEEIRFTGAGYGSADYCRFDSIRVNYSGNTTEGSISAADEISTIDGSPTLSTAAGSVASTTDVGSTTDSVAITASTVDTTPQASSTSETTSTVESATVTASVGSSISSTIDSSSNDSVSITDSNTSTVGAGSDSFSSDDSSIISASQGLNYVWYDTQEYYNTNSHPGSESAFDEFFDEKNSGVEFGGYNSDGVWKRDPTWGTRGFSRPSFLPGDGFSFKFEGYITAPETGTYIVGVDGDDAVDVFIDEQKVASWYGGHGTDGNYNHNGTIDLIAGETYRFIARHEEGGGGESISVGWQKPSDVTLSRINDKYFTRELSSTANQQTSSFDAVTTVDSNSTITGASSASNSTDSVSAATSNSSADTGITAASTTDSVTLSTSISSPFGASSASSLSDSGDIFTASSTTTGAITASSSTDLSYKTGGISEAINSVDTALSSDIVSTVNSTSTITAANSASNSTDSVTAATSVGSTEPSNEISTVGELPSISTSASSVDTVLDSSKTTDSVQTTASTVDTTPESNSTTETSASLDSPITSSSSSSTTGAISATQSTDSSLFQSSTTTIQDSLDTTASTNSPITTTSNATIDTITQTSSTTDSVTITTSTGLIPATTDIPSSTDEATTSSAISTTSNSDETTIVAGASSLSTSASTSKTTINSTGTTDSVSITTAITDTTPQAISTLEDTSSSDSPFTASILSDSILSTSVSSSTSLSATTGSNSSVSTSTSTSSFTDSVDSTISLSSTIGSQSMSSSFDSVFSIVTNSSVIPSASTSTVTSGSITISSTSTFNTTNTISVVEPVNTVQASSTPAIVLPELVISDKSRITKATGNSNQADELSIVGDSPSLSTSVSAVNINIGSGITTESVKISSATTDTTPQATSTIEASTSVPSAKNISSVSDPILSTDVSSSTDSVATTGNNSSIVRATSSSRSFDSVNLTNSLSSTTNANVNSLLQENPISSSTIASDIAANSNSTLSISGGEVSDWQYKKSITIDSSKVDGDLSDWPLLVHLDRDDDLAKNAQTDGSDIKFEDATGSQLAHEIESYDSSTGELWAHVKVPSVSASSDTKLYIHYGNDKASNQESIQDVWSNGFEGVWHLDEKSGEIIDSSANNLNASVVNTLTRPVDGQIDTGYKTNKSDAGYARVGDKAELNFDGTDKFTLFAWFRPEDYQDNQNGNIWLQHERSWIIQRDSNGMNLTCNINGNGYQYGVNPPTGEYSRAGLTFDAGELELYYNGKSKNIVSTSIESTSGEMFELLGTDRFGTEWIPDGSADEYRITSDIKSDAWISTTYTNQNNPQSFYTIGSQEELTGVASISASSQAISSPSTSSIFEPAESVTTVSSVRGATSISSSTDTVDAISVVSPILSSTSTATSTNVINPIQADSSALFAGSDSTSVDVVNNPISDTNSVQSTATTSAEDSSLPSQSVASEIVSDNVTSSVDDVIVTPSSSSIVQTSTTSSSFDIPATTLSSTILLTIVENTESLDVPILVNSTASLSSGNTNSISKTQAQTITSSSTSSNALDISTSDGVASISAASSTTEISTSSSSATESVELIGSAATIEGKSGTSTEVTKSSEQSILSPSISSPEIAADTSTLTGGGVLSSSATISQPTLDSTVSDESAVNTNNVTAPTETQNTASANSSSVTTASISSSNTTSEISSSGDSGAISVSGAAIRNSTSTSESSESATILPSSTQTTTNSAPSSTISSSKDEVATSFSQAFASLTDSLGVVKEGGDILQLISIPRNTIDSITLSALYADSLSLVRDSTSETNSLDESIRTSTLVSPSNTINLTRSTDVSVEVNVVANIERAVDTTTTVERPTKPSLVTSTNVGESVAKSTAETVYTDSTSTVQSGESDTITIDVVVASSSQTAVRSAQSSSESVSFVPSTSAFRIVESSDESTIASERSIRLTQFGSSLNSSENAFADDGSIISASDGATSISLSTTSTTDSVEIIASETRIEGLSGKAQENSVTIDNPFNTNNSSFIISSKELARSVSGAVRALFGASTEKTINTSEAIDNSIYTDIVTKDASIASIAKARSVAEYGVSEVICRRAFSTSFAETDDIKITNSTQIIGSTEISESVDDANILLIDTLLKRSFEYSRARDRPRTELSVGNVRSSVDSSISISPAVRSLLFANIRRSVISIRISPNLLDSNVRLKESTELSQSISASNISTSDTSIFVGSDTAVTFDNANVLPVYVHLLSSTSIPRYITVKRSTDSQAATSTGTNENSNVVNTGSREASVSTERSENSVETEENGSTETRDNE